VRSPDASTIASPSPPGAISEIVATTTSPLAFLRAISRPWGASKDGVTADCVVARESLCGNPRDGDSGIARSNGNSPIAQIVHLRHPRFVWQKDDRESSGTVLA
jgi:hypothetical protein